jgi:hypothetical protein
MNAILVSGGLWQSFHLNLRSATCKRFKNFNVMLFFIQNLRNLDDETLLGINFFPAEYIL